MRVILFISCFVISSAALSQSSAAKPLRSYAVEARNAAFDNLGNLYIITAGDQLKKYNQDGDSVAVYNGVVRNGKLHSVDVSNPLQVVLFYKDFGQVVVLDRLLAQRTLVDLRRSGILQPSAAGLSYDNQIWVFDAADNSLKKLDETGSVLSQTPDLRTVFDGGLQPQQIIDHNNSVYLYDSAQGLYAFDYFGTFQRKMPLTHWQNISVSKGLILGFMQNRLVQYQTGTLMQTESTLPQALQTCTGWRLGPQRMAALCTHSVQVFEWRY